MKRRMFPLALLILVISTPAVAGVVKRQNWQCLSDARKQQYIDTLKVLKNDRNPAHDSWSHPFNNSLSWYERLHNGRGGGAPANCVHNDERFVTWHRLMLWYFERALQVASNDSTMSLPYWNWSENPTGAHYPIEFETNPLLLATRANNQTKKIRYPAKSVTALIDTNPTWDMFAGEDGSLEDDPHNDLHPWVGDGGPMRKDITAATDPLFWLFHTYIDAIFDRWQRQYHYAPQPNCRTCPLGDEGFSDWTMPDVEYTRNIGYEYDLQTCPAVQKPAAEAALAAPMKLAAPHKGGEALVFDLEIPDTDFRTAEVRVAGLEMVPDVHYRGSLFIFPGDVAFAPNDARFRSRYLADRFAVWSLTHQHQATDEYYLNATTELKYLAKTQSEARWKAAVVIEEVVPVSGDVADAGASAAAKSITIDTISIVFDRGQERER